jgi:Protein of unknown function (DUF3800)
VLTIHVHLDESGDLNFSPTGTRYYIFTAAWTYDPAPLASELTALRFRLVKEGRGERLSGFHAREDAQPRRDLVLGILVKHPTWSFASIVVDKRRVNPVLYDPEKFYPKFATMVLRFVFKGRLRPKTSGVLIYTDTLPFSGKQARAAEVAIKAECRRDLPDGLPFHVLHHRRESNSWIQVADYCSWTICRKWEHGEKGIYDQLRVRLAATEIDPTSLGDGKIYYDFK